MNEIRRVDREARLIAKISAVVERHGWPEFITGFGVRLGDFDGDPAAWIWYYMEPTPAMPLSSYVERADKINALQDAVGQELKDVDEDRLFFFRFGNPSI